MSPKLKSPISIQGIKGSFHDIAKHHLFGPDARILGRDTFAEVFSDVTNQRASQGLIAIENSIAGPILENYDHLDGFPVSINAEIYLNIRHHLISFPGTKVTDIKEVHSHPMSFKQCRKFFNRHPQIKQVINPDTSAAVRMIKQKRLTHTAAIASSSASKIFEMSIIKRNLEDTTNNYTRFLGLTRSKTYSKNSDKTTILVQIPNQPASLHQALGYFATRKINLVTIESRPIISKTWHYTFFLDFEAGFHQPKFNQALKQLKSFALHLKVLGSYKRGEYITS